MAIRPVYDKSWASDTGEKLLNWSHTCSTIAANWLVCKRLTMNTRTQQKANTKIASAAKSRRASRIDFLRTARFKGKGSGFGVQECRGREDRSKVGGERVVRIRVKAAVDGAEADRLDANVG